MTMRAILLSAALPLLAASAAQAQKLEPGKWTGTITPPGEQPAVEVTYDVTVNGDSLSMTINAGEHGSFPASGMKLAAGKLTFAFTPGPPVDCTLTRQDDGAYSGTCKDPQGGIATLVMNPPKK